MAIDVRSISITGAFNAIKSFFLSQENNSRWKDTQTGAEGNFLMRLLANVIRVISQNCVTGRRENNLETANLLSSNIGIGVTTGSYPTYRGRNQRRLINFTPYDNLTVPKFTKIGSVGGDYGIYTLSDLTFVAKEPQEFPVVIGNFKEISWTANTTALKKFIRFEQGISEDIDLYVDGVSMSEKNALSKYVKDMIYDKYCVLTNPHKSVTIQYLNNAPNARFPYRAETPFVLKYIELDDVSVGDFTNEMFADYGTLNYVLTIENFIPFEDVESIKMNAPVHREVQSLVRSKIDFADLVREFVPAVYQTNAKPLTPTYTAVTYMKRDNSLMESFEKENLAESLEPCMAFGRPQPDIVDPIKERTTLDVTIGATNRYTDEASITVDVQSMVDSEYANKLNASFDKYDFENILNKLAYAKYSRVDVHVDERKPLTEVHIGDCISYKDLYYKCTGILGQTGVNEPEWNIPSIGTNVEQIDTTLETTDNTIIWRCYKKLNISEIQSWKPSKKIALGEFVYSDTIPQYMFKAVDVMKVTPNAGPDVTLTEVGDYVQDGEMTLLCITYNDAYPSRVSGAHYRLGDKFNFNGLSFEYVGMTGVTSSADELTFNDAKYKLVEFSNSDFEKAYAHDNNQVCLYIDDLDASTKINYGDILRVNIVEQVEKEWEEVPADLLTMNSKLDAEVKDYEDQDEEDEDSGDSGSQADVSITVENFFTGNVIPDISNVELGGSISDGDFTLNRIPYDASYPERISSYAYNNNDKFTITVWKEETDPETGEVKEVVDYAYSFVTVVHIIDGVEIVTVDESGQTEEEKEIQNKGWKELEKYLKLEDEIQEWIASEDADKLRCPYDVIEFMYEAGRLNGFDGDKTPETVKNTLLNIYYKQYDEYDEKQIYMYMDAMNATRGEAIATMSRTDKSCLHQLKEPIADAYCVKQYDADGNLVYIDKYSSEQPIDTKETTETGEIIETTYPGFKVTRTDINLVERAVRTYIYKDDGVVLYKEDINNDSESVSNVYLVTADDAKHATRDYNGGVKEFTRITPHTAIPRYSKGYVNISFKKTDDGSVRWEQISGVDSIDYDWNKFANYDINLTVKY